MKDTIREGMEQLYELLVPYSDMFNKRTYDDSFKDEYEKFTPLFKKIISECEQSDDVDSFIDEIASIMPDKIHAELNALPNKNRQQLVLMKYNLGLVSYVLPMLLYGRNEYLNQLVNRITTLWNDYDIDMKIEPATYETIKDGFKFHLCYITTAVCDSLGKGDNCYELNLLRDYRDKFLVNTVDGKELIDEYYDIAPTIVNRINKREDAHSIYQNIWDNYLSPCVVLIENNKMDECCKKYKDMVISLKNKYLHSYS